MVHPDEVRHVAKLARLALTPAEAEEAAVQLGRILEYMELLGELDGDEGDEATRLPADLSGGAGSSPSPAPPLRPDEPGPTLTRQQALADAPKTDGETFLVPPVLDGGGAP